MESTPLLAHLAGRFVAQRENLATEALTYVLGRSKVARSSIISHFTRLGATLPADLTFRTQATGDDESIPDVVGEDLDQNQRLTIEAKFWAGLTAAQPTRYIERIQGAGGGTLAFLLPEKRGPIIWHELLSRCRNAGMTVREEADGVSGTYIAVVNNVVLLVLVTWSHLLTELLISVESAAERDVAADIRQLQGLCAREDAEAFLPFGSEELTSSTFPKRILQVCDLVDDLTIRLVQKGSADVKKLKAQGSKGWYGKYLRLRGYPSLLHFSAHKWGSRAFTPLWLQVYGVDWRRDPALASFLIPRCVEADIPAHESAQGIEVPIMLPSNVERDAVFATALLQIERVGEWLAELGPVSTPSTEAVPPEAEQAEEIVAPADGV